MANRSGPARFNRRGAPPGAVVLFFWSFLSLAAAGCSYMPWFRGPETPLAPLWDSVSPPPLAYADSLVEPEPIAIGVPPPSGGTTRNMNVLHYDVELVLPPENDRVSTRTTIRYLRDGVGPHLVELDFTGLPVVLVTHRGRALDFVQDEGLLRFQSPGRPGIYDTLQVEVMARGVPDDGLILRDNVHGAPSAFADNWPDRARYWFPANDHPSDKATVSFTVHAPEGKRVIANGVQVGAPVPADSSRTGGIGGLVTWRWESRVSIPTYLMVVGVAEMEVLDQGLAACGRAPASPRPDGCVEVTGWAFPADLEHAAQVFARAPQMVDLYAGLLGPYPFEKLANVQSSTRFGGMENASAIFYSEQAIAQRRDIEGTVAHEIAHQWFGNSVTPAEWSHLWLSEGFASYLGPYFWEHAESDAAFKSRITRARAEYLDSDVVGRPVVDESVSNLLDLLNENSYEKGALVLHMLRWVMGDRAFFAGLQRYYLRHAGGNVVTADFQRAMEDEYGQSLEWFFQPWLYRPGYPVFRTAWSWDEGAHRARVNITQIQDLSWPVYRLPIELEFQLDGGVHRVTQWIEAREWVMEVAIPERPAAMRLDPDGWILMREERTSGP
ncbi:MAG: M1 family metallopeptidase [Gemmatimonadota bacterium]